MDGQVAVEMRLSRVKMRRDGEDRLRMELAVIVWTIASKRASRRGANANEAL